MDEVRSELSINEQYVRARIKEFHIPPIKDGLIIGKRSAIGADALRRSLGLLCIDKYEHVLVEGDDIVGDIFLRSPLLRKVSKERVTRFIIEKIKPLMSDTEILLLDFEIDLVIDGKL